jgi:hypothetical protein
MGESCRWSKDHRGYGATECLTPQLPLHAAECLSMDRGEPPEPIGVQSVACVTSMPKLTVNLVLKCFRRSSKDGFGSRRFSLYVSKTFFTAG